MNSYDKIIAALMDLIRAAKPFLSDRDIVETTGTLPLLDALANLIDDAEVLLSEVTKWTNNNSSNAIGETQRQQTQ